MREVQTIVKEDSAERLKRALETIDLIAMVNNPDENNKVLNDIYKIAHAFSGRCKNYHQDWRDFADEMYEKLKDY